MKNPWILPAAALAVGAVGGFISGKSGSESTSSASAQTTQRTRSSNRESASNEAEKRGGKATSIKDIYKRPGSSSRVQAMLEFYSSLTAEQLANEAKKLGNLPLSERMTASFLLFGRWAEVDPTAAMAFSNTMGFAGAFVRPTILQSWASTDPANAAKYYSENPGEFAMMNMGGGRMGGQNPASIIASEWARQDPDAALAWANALGNGKGDALASVVGEVAKTDPKKAADLAAKMDPANQKEAYVSIASQWGASNFSDAKAWISSLPADQQAEALATAIRGLATTNPAEAASQAAALEPGREANQTISETARNWAREDPAATAAWLSTQQSERARQDAMEPLMSSWVAQDSAAALAYVNAQPAGNVRDSAVASYINANISADPSSQTTLAESIANDRDRARTVATLYNRWKQTDATAANAYIQQSTSIPDNMKQRLTEGRGNWGGPGGPGGRPGGN